MSDEPTREPDVLHRFKNLSIVVGFCDLLLAALPAEDPRHADVLEIHKAGRAAMALVPELAKRIR